MSSVNISSNCTEYLNDGTKTDIKPDGDTEININDNMADDSRKIFVGGLSWETNEDDLKRYFCDFGEVKSCVIKLDRYTNQSRGFGFVIFDSEESVNRVLDHKEHILNKKKIDPKKAKPSREPQKKVFIGGIDPDMSESKIREYFTQFGEIENIETPFDIRKNKRKAYLFITFTNEAEARKAAQQECQEINGKKFEVRIAVPRDQANRTKGWKSPNNSLYYPYTMLPYMYPEYLYSYMYSNPHLFNQYYNPYDCYNYDPMSLSRQFQTGLMINNGPGQQQTAGGQQQQRPKMSPQSHNAASGSGGGGFKNNSLYNTSSNLHDSSHHSHPNSHQHNSHHIQQQQMPNGAIGSNVFMSGKGSGLDSSVNDPSGSAGGATDDVSYFPDPSDSSTSTSAPAATAATSRSTSNSPTANTTASTTAAASTAVK